MMQMKGVSDMCAVVSPYLESSDAAINLSLSSCQRIRGWISPEKVGSLVVGGGRVEKGWVYITFKVQRIS